MPKAGYKAGGNFLSHGRNYLSIQEFLFQALTIFHLRTRHFLRKFFFWGIMDNRRPRPCYSAGAWQGWEFTHRFSARIARFLP